jgi:hypothetical protein
MIFEQKINKPMTKDVTPSNNSPNPSKEPIRPKVGCAAACMAFPVVIKKIPRAIRRIPRTKKSPTFLGLSKLFFKIFVIA